MKKNEILKAAFELFALQGYEATSMQQISDAVNLKKQSLYAYFGGKSEIYVTILKAHAQQYADSVLQAFRAMNGSAPEYILKSFFMLTVKFFNNKEKLLFFKHAVLTVNSKTNTEIFGELESTLIETHRKILFELYRTLRMKRKNLSKRQLRELLVHLMIMLQGFLNWLMRHLGEKKRIEQMANSMWEAFWKENNI